MMDAMIQQRFVPHNISQPYYKTLISTASYFSLCKEAGDKLKECNDIPDQQNVIFKLIFQIFSYENTYKARVLRLININKELFYKYMKRCIYEYTTKCKRSINTADGKSYVEDIIKANTIEEEIISFINKSKCKIDKKDYTTNLINAIVQMYEVISIL